MERDERMIVYGDVDRVGEEVIREHMYGRTINVCWDVSPCHVKGTLHHESVLGEWKYSATHG